MSKRTKSKKCGVRLSCGDRCMLAKNHGGGHNCDPHERSRPLQLCASHLGVLRSALLARHLTELADAATDYDPARDVTEALLLEGSRME